MFTIFSGCGNAKDAKDYYKEGLKSFEDGEYKKAEESLKKAVTNNTEKAEYYIDYGFALIKMEKHEEAQVQFNKGILDKDNKIVRENNKRAHRGKGIAYYESADFTKAITEFDAALNINDMAELNIDLLYYKGSSYEKLGDFKKALEAYTAVLNEKKPDAKIYGALAGVKYQLGETKEAISYYDKAIELEPDGYDHYFGKYAILSREKDTKSAKEVLAKALAIKTKTDSDYYNLAKLHYLSDDFTNAKTGLETAVEKGFYEAYFYLGEIAYEDKDYDSAVKFYEDYMNSNIQIKMTSVYHQLSSALIQIGEYEKASQVIREGIALNDAATLALLKYNEVAVYEKLGDFKTAYEKAKEYVKAYPDNKDMVREVNFLKTRVMKASK